MYGDAQTMNVGAQGGNDLLVGDINQIVSGSAIVTGGNDIQYGNGGIDTLYGDTNSVLGSATVNGGIDTQYGGTEGDFIVGDAFNVLGSATVNGGIDTQYGEAGNDDSCW